MDRRSRILRITQAAVIAAVYAVLTVVFAPISYGPAQIRIAEALSILPMFTPAAIPGLFIGCLTANILGGAVILDIVFGSLATLIGAWLGYLLRKSRWLVPLPAVIANALIIPYVLKFGYGYKEFPLPVLIIYIAIGEIIGCYVLGELLGSILLKYRGKLFRKQE